MKNWIVVATFFCLWISTSFSSEVQSYFAYILILTFGILHGANDINLMMKSEKSVYPKVFWKILLLYISAIFFILVLFVQIPVLAMILFIAFSGYHFGEQYLKERLIKESKWSIVLYAFHGMTILFMIFYAKINEVIPIFKQLTGITLEESFFKDALIIVFIAYLISLLLFGLKKYLEVTIVREIFNLIVLIVVFKTANLLWGFCIYFVLWHSIPSLQDQLKILYGKVDKSSLLKYLRASWPYWLISILGLGVVYFLFKDNEQLFINVLIYLLAAITIPHILVMSRLENTKN